MKSGPRSILAIIAAVVGASIGGAPMPCAGVPVITAEQIEADWHRQDELYNLEAAKAAAESDAHPVDYRAD
ncbi:MAG: hypothetical protein ACYSUV_12705 [Planctomycetota bacterium]